MSFTWKLFEDGSFDINAGSIMLKNCYPSLDGLTIRPVSVEVKRNQSGGEVRYTLTKGLLTLGFTTNEGSLRLSSELKGLDTAPHWVYPIAQAVLNGADRFYKQGLGFSGPSGIKELAEQKGTWSFDSHMVAGLIAPDDTTIAIGAYQQRDFLQRSTLYKREHRWGLNDRHEYCSMLLFEAGFSTENIALQQNILVLPDIHFIIGDKPFETFKKLAEGMALAGQARTKALTSYHWCSWYDRTCYFTMEDLNTTLDGISKIQPTVPIHAIQIDDGYCDSPGDWLIHSHLWPQGLPAAFSKIEQVGYHPGIWIAPFMVGRRSKLYQNHPEWMLHNLNGNIIDEWSNYECSNFGSHTDEETYILDTSHPEAFEYLRTVFRTLKSWGATYFKTDFMDWGLKDSLLVKRHTPGKTSVQYFVDVMKMIREEIGEESFWLGCICPFSPSIGFVDGIRLANDVSCGWSEGSVGNMLNESFADQYFNHVLWQNDNDVLYVRERFSHLSNDETISIALWDAFLGGIVNTSDPLYCIPEERLKLWRFIQPSQEHQTATLPYWAKTGKFKVAVREFKGAKQWALLLLNPSDETMVTEKFTIKELFGIEEAYCFEWGPGWNKPIGKCSILVPTISNHASVLYFINTIDEAPAKDLALSGINVEGL